MELKRMQVILKMYKNVLFKNSIIMYGNEKVNNLNLKRCHKNNMHN